MAATLLPICVNGWQSFCWCLCRYSLAGRLQPAIANTKPVPQPSTLVTMTISTRLRMAKTHLPIQPRPSVVIPIAHPVTRDVCRPCLGQSRLHRWPTHLWIQQITGLVSRRPLLNALNALSGVSSPDRRGARSFPFVITNARIRLARDRIKPTSLG